LLHDVGHPPFSHAAEAALAAGISHEEMGKRILLETELGDVIDENYRHLAIDRNSVVDLWSGALPPNARFLTDLISSNLDCDRMDYLVRDSHYAGVAYGRFDQERLLTTLTVTSDEAGLLRLAVHEGGVYALESLILARYFMFLQVYFHKVRRVLDRTLERYVGDRGGYPSDMSKYLSLNDDVLWTEMEQSSNRWAQMIVRRKPFRQVYQSDPMADDTTMAAYRLKGPELEAQFGDEVILDDAATSTHKFELPYGPLSSSGTKLTVVGEEGSVNFHERSHVVANLPTAVRWIRIFAAEEVCEAVKHEWNAALTVARS
jgi:HD superfamily phosphohydrolase